MSDEIRGEDSEDGSSGVDARIQQSAGGSVSNDDDWELLLERLRGEIVSLVDIGNQYLDLFGSTPERVALLNRTAAFFFATVQDLMIRGIILGISRLTDPVRHGANANLTLAVLLESPEAVGDAALRTNIEAKLKQVRDKASPIRRHRNKYIAHLDRATALGEIVNPAFTRQELMDAVAAVGEVYQEYMLRGRGIDSDLQIYSSRSTNALLRAIGPKASNGSA